MKRKVTSLFQRVLSMLLCVAMLFSYIVLPADATGSTDEDSAEKTVSNAVPELKFELKANTLNYYEKDKPVLVYGNWLQYLADNGYTSLSNMLKNEAEQYVDLMPAEGATQWDTNVLATNAIPTFHDDGTVTITNNAVYTGNHYWPYVSTTPSMTIDLDATPYLYFSYSGNAEFNLAFYYNGITDTNVSVGSNYLGSDFPEGTHTYCIDLKACTGLSGKISLDKCLFYVIGGTNDYVTLSNIGLSSINLTQDSDIRKGVYLDGYTALMIEFMGNVKSGQSGAEGAEYFVDAVLDCGVAFDEAPHQLLSKTQYGFVLYIPDAVMDTLDKKPARGDLIDATFSYNELSELTQSGTCELWRTLYFYENPSEAIKYATATDVNATVNLFNYGENISQNGFNFWNGYWGWGPAIESVDGAGTEDGVYRNPVPMDTLTSDGYPQLSDGNGGSYGLDYLFNGSTGLVDTMTNGGGLFQMDEDGYYYYDSMQNAAYYDSEKESFVLYEDLIVRPWYHSNGGFDYKADSNYKDYANVGGDATVYGNFLPFNKVTEENITVDGAVYYNQITDGILNADGNTYYTEIHAVDESYTAFRNAAGSLEKYGLNNTAADKVLAGTKAMFKDAYDEIVQVNGGDVMTARLEDKLDLGFGMTVDFDFYMPQGGKVNGEAMEFDFLGDDDVFVYVGIWTGEEYEYKLVLDIGGIHEAKNGNIDFSTGAVADWPCSNTAARTGRTLRSIFGDAYAEYFDGDTFADFTKLSLKFFYLERGGNISYCRLRFNIPTLPENSLTIGKALDHEVLGSQTYQFRVLKAVWNETTQKYEATDELFIPEGTEYTIAGSSKTGTVGAGGYFPLSPGQSVTFHNVLASSHGTHYVVEETITQEVDSQFTIESPVCAVNGVSAEVTEVENAPEGQYVYRTEALVLNTTESQRQARSVKTQIVGFTNMVDVSQLGTLKISKEIERGANIPEDAEFDMCVTLGGALLPVGTTYDVVDTATGAIISDDVEVTTKGIVTLKADQTVVIEGILSTSTIEVVEDSSIYSASYYSQSSTIQCSNKGAAGIMPLGGVIEVIVTNDDSNVITDKTVAEGAADDEFVLTLEAFATGITNTVSLTAPADIVLVLDQSASMYTPKGATSDHYDRWGTPSEIYATAGIGKLDSENSLIAEKGSKLGYYVAQTKTANRAAANGANIYDWFIAQYVDGTGWLYVRVGDTTTPVVVDVSGAQAYTSNDGGSQYYKTVHSNNKDANGEYLPIDTFYYYESQYSALYESVTDFVKDLAKTGVDHRIAITGFSSPYYDGIKDYDGSGLYIDGTYYLYDTDYKYCGYFYDASPTDYILYVPNDAYYESMKGVLPADLEGITWTRTKTDNDVLVRLDPNQKNYGGTVTGTQKTYTDGQYYAAFKATDSSMTDYNVVTGQYGNALVSVKTNLDSILASVENIRTNYKQTCPAVGLDMAQKIFKAYENDVNDKIVVLFTDGVPTVSLNADQDYAESQNAGIREMYHSGMSGAKDAINLANTLKSDDVQIYTIGTSGLSADVPIDTNNSKQLQASPVKFPITIESITGEEFLEYVSSNHEGITCTHTIFTVGEAESDNRTDDNTNLATSQLVISQNGTVVTITTAVKSADSYAKSSASGSITDSIADAFGEIMTSVSSASVTLDQTAILKEYLSGYFDLNDVDPEDIQVFVAKVNGQVDGKYTFDEAVSVAPLTDDNRAFAETNGFANIGVKFSANEAGRSDTVVEVNGFDYAGNYVHQDTTTGEWIGYKIIVEVPIKDRAGFWGGNNVPTNENITAIYDDKGNEVQDFPMPEVNIPVTPVISTKNQVVYYADGTIKAEHVFDKVTVDGYLVVYDEAEGTFVPGDLTSDADDWMDDYASLNWSSGSCTLDTPISSVEEGDYTFGVTLAPLKDHTGKDNMSANGSNIAGDPVSMSGSSASSTGHVDVLVPVLNFQDSTITLGDETDKDYYDATNDVTDYDNMTWVDMNDPNDESGALKGAFATMGTEPELTLSYSPEGTGENYFQVDTPVDVTVKIGELNITEKSYFMWENCESGLHDEAVITTHKGDVDSYEFYIHVAYVLGNDVVVIDFGLPVDISVMGNDKLPDGATVKGVMIGSLPSGMTDSLSAEFVQSLTSNSIHGKVTVMANSAVRYEPADMNMSAAETFIYAVEAVNGRTAYYYATVTVVPATNIYYEDSFLSFENSTAADADDAAATLGKWTQSDDTASDATQAEDRPGVDLGDALKELDADNVYGYDAAYDEMTTYSLNNAWHVTVDAATGNATTAPKATFSFTGTGFDVISVTDSTSGAIWVKVTDKDGKVVRSSIVNNYYGFAYDSESGEWNPAEENDGSVLYQVPAIKISGLDYATYDVEIKAVYLSSMDVEKTGSYTIWLDAIRIYNPAMNDSISNDVYEQDGEANPWYTTVKSLLTGTDTFVNGSADGIMFIDGKGTNNVTMIDYANQGPNNETYLLGGNGIAFKLLSNSVNEPDVSLQIGAKLAYGTSATLKYNDSELKTLTTASNMFYKLGELTWTQVTIDGITCWASNSIVLSCVAAEGNILALTDIKVTGDDAASISASNSDNPFENSGLAAVTDDQVMDDATTGAVTLRAKYGSLSMVGQVMLNVYFEGTGLESISTDDMGLLLWSEQPADATYANAEKILPGATYSSQYNQYWSQTNGIPAKNMGDDIYFRVYAKLTDGTYVYSQMIKYSPKIYAMDRLANSNSDAMKKLCVALLNYGAAAQLQAGYKTDALMNADLTAEQLASIEDYSSSMVTGGNAVTEAKAGSFGIVNTGFSSRYPSVSFEGAFSINYYFTPSRPVRGDVTLYVWSAEDYANVDVLTTANATTAVRMTLLEDGRYWADYTDISARKVNEKVYVCAVYKTDGAVAHTSGVVAYSVADYCVDRVTNSTNPNMQALAMATVVYSHYAKQYFG